MISRSLGWDDLCCLFNFVELLYIQTKCEKKPRILSRFSRRERTWQCYEKRRFVLRTFHVILIVYIHVKGFWRNIMTYKTSRRGTEVWCIYKAHKLPQRAALESVQRINRKNSEEMQIYQSYHTTKQLFDSKIPKSGVTSYLSSGRNGLYSEASAFGDWVVWGSTNRSWSSE